MLKRSVSLRQFFEYPQRIFWLRNKKINFLVHTLVVVIRLFGRSISLVCSVSARPEFLGVIDDPLFENLGIIGKFRGSELFNL